MFDEQYYADDTLGGRLSAARDHAGITLSALAAEIGVEGETLRNWECDRSAPSVERLVRIARILKVRPLWLISGDVDTPQTYPSILIARGRTMRSDVTDPLGAKRAVRYVQFQMPGARTTH